MSTQLLSNWSGNFAQLPITWGTIFSDAQYRFWHRLCKQYNMARPAGDLSAYPALAWQAMERAGVTVMSFLYALEAVNVPAHRACAALVRNSPEPDRIFDALAEIPMLMNKWNDWLSAYYTCNIQVGARVLRVTDLPRFSGSSMNDFKLHLRIMYQNDKKLLFLVGRLFELNNVGRALDLIQEYGVTDWFFVTGVAAATGPAEDFEGLIAKLREFVILETDFLTWVNASSHQVQRCGLLVPQSGMSKVMWLQTIRNQYPERLKILGQVLLYQKCETSVILNAIQEYGCNKLFGIESLAQTTPTPAAGPIHAQMSVQVLPGTGSWTVPVAPPIHDALEYLLGKLDSRNLASTASRQRRVDRIEGALADPEINDKVRGQFPQLLPVENVTMLDIYKNCSANWTPLLCVMVSWAENQLARNTTFRIDMDIRSALSAAAEHAERWVPFTDKVLYNPTTNATDREVVWLASIGEIATVDDLLRWNGEPADGRTLTPNETRSLVADLGERLTSDPALAKQVLEEIAGKKPKWNMLLPDALPKMLNRASNKPQQPVQLPEATGWAKQFLQGLGIKNDKLYAQLQEFDDSNGKDLKYLTPALADKLLDGLNVKEAVKVRKAIAEQVGVTL